MLFVDEANRLGDETAAAAAAAAQLQKQNSETSRDVQQTPQQTLSTPIATSTPVCLMPSFHHSVVILPFRRSVVPL